MLKVGDRVVFNANGAEQHRTHGWCIPEVGTMGVVREAPDRGNDVVVEWDINSTVGVSPYYDENKKIWYAKAEHLTKIKGWGKRK